MLLKVVFPWKSKTSVTSSSKKIRKPDSRRYFLKVFARENVVNNQQIIYEEIIPHERSEPNQTFQFYYVLGIFVERQLKFLTRRKESSTDGDHLE